MALSLASGLRCKKSKKRTGVFKSYPRKNGIIQADKQILQKLLKKFKHVVVYFHSKRCSKCKRLNQQFPKIVKEHLSFMEPNLVPVVRFNCSKFPEYCSLNQKISHFPCVRVYYKHKHFTTFRNHFKPHLLAKFLTQRVFYSSFAIGQANYTMDHLLSHDQLVVLHLDRAVFRSEDRYRSDAPPASEDARTREQKLEAFKLLGFRTHHAHFYFTENLEELTGHYARLCRQVDPSHEVTEAAFALISPDDGVCYLFEESLVKKRYDGELVADKAQVDKALEFIKDHQKPLIMEFTQKTVTGYKDKNMPFVTYFTPEGGRRANGR